MYTSETGLPALQCQQSRAPADQHRNSDDAATRRASSQGHSEPLERRSEQKARVAIGQGSSMTDGLLLINADDRQL